MNKTNKTLCSLILFLIPFLLPGLFYGQGEVFYREAGNTLTPIEMNKGDTLKFKMRNGELRTLVLEETSAEILFLLALALIWLAQKSLRKEINETKFLEKIK